MKVIHQEYGGRGTVEYDLGTMRRVILRADDGHEIEISDETKNGNGFEIRTSDGIGNTGRLIVCPAYSNAVHVFHEEKFETLRARMLRMREGGEKKKKGD